MIAEKVKKSNIGVGIGIVLEIAGRFLMASGAPLIYLGVPILVAGVVIFIWGCFNYRVEPLQHAKTVLKGLGK